MQLLPFSGHHPGDSESASSPWVLHLLQKRTGGFVEWGFSGLDVLLVTIPVVIRAQKGIHLFLSTTGPLMERALLSAPIVPPFWHHAPYYYYDTKYSMTAQHQSVSHFFASNPL